MGRHISSMIYIEYANTGSEPMPAPLLVLSRPPKWKTASRSSTSRYSPSTRPSRCRAFGRRACRTGYSHTVEILASGTVPGVLEPGESVKVPVYYAGMQQPWYFPDTFYFSLQVYGQIRQDGHQLEQPAIKPPALGHLDRRLECDLQRPDRSNRQYLGRLRVDA